MLDNVWAFLQDPANRAVLGWIGAGMVTALGGLWAVVKFLAKKDKPDPTPSVRAENQSVASGGGITNSAIHIGTPPSGKN